MIDHSKHGPWYHKNIATQPSFGGESTGSPLLTLAVGVAIGALGVTVYNNRQMLKKHILAIGHGTDADRDTLRDIPAFDAQEFKLPTSSEIKAAGKRLGHRWL